MEMEDMKKALKDLQVRVKVVGRLSQHLVLQQGMIEKLEKRIQKLEQYNGNSAEGASCEAIDRFLHSMTSDDPEPEAKPEAPYANGS
mmetsp:Transcript_2206/g.2822  ORF Transcript_2206/g.2822 Transcript_2206/m.2822 type:complete len:87 (+) Transcript_2206:137-397(+)